MSIGGLERTDTDATIRLRVNGGDRSVPAGQTVRGLIESLNLIPETIVVEHNLEILDRDAYAKIHLREGDRLELVHFVGGG
jgi:thiamine biosynthesis protein ThiS